MISYWLTLKDTIGSWFLISTSHSSRYPVDFAINKNDACEGLQDASVQYPFGELKIYNKQWTKPPFQM